MVKAWTTPVDATEVTHSHAAKRADRPSPTIPRPRAAEGPLEVREARRYGRHRLYVDTVDGGVVGWLSLNNGAIKLTEEADRPWFQAAIVGWFADALPGAQVPAPTPERPTATSDSGGVLAPPASDVRAQAAHAPPAAEAQPQIPGPRHRRAGAHRAR
jgi:hypothetical protein